MAGVCAVFHVEPPPPMLFVVVENKPPHAVALYTLDDESRGYAARQRQGFMRRVDECAKADEWPGYSIKVESLSLPRWQLMQEVE